MVSLLLYNQNLSTIISFFFQISCNWPWPFALARWCWWNCDSWGLCFWGLSLVALWEGSSSSGEEVDYFWCCYDPLIFWLSYWCFCSIFQANVSVNIFLSLPLSSIYWGSNHFVAIQALTVFHLRGCQWLGLVVLFFFLKLYFACSQYLQDRLKSLPLRPFGVEPTLFGSEIKRSFISLFLGFSLAWNFVPHSIMSSISLHNSQ